jgi:hypothetical protein
MARASGELAGIRDEGVVGNRLRLAGIARRGSLESSELLGSLDLRWDRVWVRVARAQEVVTPYCRVAGRCS